MKGEGMFYVRKVHLSRALVLLFPEEISRQRAGVSGRKPPALGCSGWAGLEAERLRGAGGRVLLAGRRASPSSRPGQGIALQGKPTITPPRSLCRTETLGTARALSSSEPAVGQGGSTAAGGVLVPGPAVSVAASASSLDPSAPCNCTAAQRASSSRQG